MMRQTETPLVVCVDDEPAILGALKRVLRDEPYLVLATQDPGEALRWTGEHDVCVVVSDQRMPGMTGSELLQTVYDRSPRTSRIMLTGFPEDRARSLCLQGVIRRMITKPWDDDDLRGALRESVREAAPASQRLDSQVRDPLGLGARSGPGPLGRRTEEERPRAFREIVHVIDLEGRTGSEAMGIVTPLLQFARAVHSGLLILIRNLGLMQGSIAGMLKDLRRAAESDGVPLCLLDGSGLVRTLDEALGPAISLFATDRGRRGKTSKRVLVVEDHEDIGELLRTIIESEGHTCQVVGTVGPALRRLKPGSFDLVFVDLDLPDGDGLVVAKCAAEEAPGTEVILLSASLGERGKAAYRRLGIRTCIRKPFRVKAIVKAIR